MIIIGNLFLLIAALACFGLVMTFSGKMPGGDAGVGYAWGLILLNLVFVACMIIVAIIIGIKGGFDWVSADKSRRVMIVTIGLLSVVLTSAICSLFKNEPGPVSGLIRFYSTFVPILIPIVLIIAGAILLNDSLKSAVPIGLYKWPLLFVSIIGVTGLASAILGFIAQSSRNQTARIEETLAFQDRNHERILQDIDSCDATKNMIFILVFTGDNQDPDIKEKAVAKVKTNPEWQKELIWRLGTDWAPQVFQFLASNDVDDPALFIEPVREGVFIQARLIRESIRKASYSGYFYPELFTWEVERVLRTVDRFSGMGVDYRPAVKELRAALDEPTDVEKTKLDCIKLLDSWIKKHP